MLPPQWRPAPAAGTHSQALRRPGSLTARLACHGQVSVQVLASGWRPARADEAEQLGLPGPGRRLYARMVCIRVNGQVAVLADSVTTAQGIAGPWRGLRRLGNRPLATILWTDPLIRREPFQFARLGPTRTLLRRGGHAAALPARRSRFWRNNEPLLVLEAFAGLPWPYPGLLARRRGWIR